MWVSGNDLSCPRGCLSALANQLRSWRGTAERLYGVRDVVAYARESAAVGGGECVEALLLSRLANGGAPGLRFAVLGSTHDPDRVQRRGLTERRFQTFHFDRDPVFRVRIQRLLEQRHAWGPGRPHA